MERRSSLASARSFQQPAGQDLSHPVVLGFASRAERSRPQAQPLLSATSCPSSPLTRGLRESVFGVASDKRASEAPQEAPSSGAESDQSGVAGGHSSGDEQDAPRMPGGCLERTLSGSMPVCIPGDRRRCERALPGRITPLWGFGLVRPLHRRACVDPLRATFCSGPAAHCGSPRSPAGLPGAAAAAIARPTVSRLWHVTDSGTPPPVPPRPYQLAKFGRLGSVEWAA